MTLDFEQFRPKAPMTAPQAVAPDFTPAQKRAIEIARSVWLRELNTLKVHIEDDAETCALCGTSLIHTWAWAFYEGEPRNGTFKMGGYIGVCCFDLAIGFGVTRAEVVARGSSPSHLGRVVEIPVSAVIELAERRAVAHERNAER